MNVLVMTSRCHTTTKEWKAQEWSPAWLREEAKKRHSLKRVIKSAGAKAPEFELESFREGGYDGTQSLKHHWVSATICNQIANPTGKKAHGWRCVDGKTFKGLPEHQRCGTCENELQQA